MTTVGVQVKHKYEIPDHRLVPRWAYIEDRHQYRGLNVVTTLYWGENSEASVDVKGWCQRLKKNGEDVNVPPTDAYDALGWLTPADWKTITVALMASLAAVVQREDILAQCGAALDKAEAKCTWGTDGDR